MQRLCVLDQFNQDARDSFDAELSGIEDQVIIGTCAPFHAGIIIIVAPALFIVAADNCISLLRRDIIVLDGALDAEVHIRGDEYAEQAALAAEDTLMINPLDRDPENHGGSFRFQKGKLTERTPFDEESILIVRAD